MSLFEGVSPFPGTFLRTRALPRAEGAEPGGGSLPVPLEKAAFRAYLLHESGSKPMKCMAGPRAGGPTQKERGDEGYEDSA